MALDAVLAPLQIGPVTVRNRIAITAHMTGYAEQGLVSDTLIEYLRARARGGVGLIVTEAGAVHESYRPASFQLFRDDVGPGLARLAESVHAEGTLIFGQANHGGAASPPLPEGRPALSASDNDGIYGAAARAMTHAEIAEIQDAFVHAARVFSDAGLDGCEVHGAHHYLVNSFLSPLYNRRTDQYGGSLDNRLRFVAQILERMRAETKPGFVLGVRLSADVGPCGLDPEGLLAVGQGLADRGLVDYVGFSLGGRTPEAFPLMTGGMETEAGYELAWNGLASRALTVPTLVTGRYRTLEQADAAVASGVTDLVGMTRAHIADPDLVCKTMAGTVEQVRPCIGCNECVRAIITQGAVRCAVNPALPRGGGTEDLVVRARRPRRVTVVGGGPAGMEAARVAALNGHAVTLLEASGCLGGLTRLYARVITNAHGHIDVLDWTQRELDRLGVEIRLDTPADRQTLLATEPELVIVATGSVGKSGARQTPRPGAVICGSDLPHVVASRAVLDLVEMPASAIVFDELGEYEALGVAEYLVASGVQVTFVTPFPAVGMPLEATGRPSMAIGRMRESNRFQARTLSMVAAVAESTAEIEDVLGHRTETIAAELVVMVVRPEPVRPEWVESIDVPVEVVGDALLPRSYKTAVREGYVAALDVDTIIDRHVAHTMEVVR